MSTFNQHESSIERASKQKFLVLLESETHSVELQIDIPIGDGSTGAAALAYTRWQLPQNLSMECTTSIKRVIIDDCKKEAHLEAVVIWKVIKTSQKELDFFDLILFELESDPNCVGDGKYNMQLKLPLTALDKIGDRSIENTIIAIGHSIADSISRLIAVAMCDGWQSDGKENHILTYGVNSITPMP